MELYTIWLVVVRRWIWTHRTTGSSSPTADAMVEWTPRNIARAALISTLVIVFVVSCIMIYELAVQHSENHIVAWFVGGIFVMLAVPISVYDVIQHFLHYTQPHLQRFVVRIIWMVPIYSIESWLSLRFKAEAIYLQTARECYEAYVIYSFYMFLARYIGTNRSVRKALRRHGAVGHHMKPFCCFRGWKMGSEFFSRTSFGVFQYVLIKVILTLLTMILVKVDEYGEGEFTNFSKGFVYITVIANVSQVWAMYCLVLFYHTLQDNYEGIYPKCKLLCIKGVVFFTFWQSVGISGMVALGWIQPTLTYTADEVSAGLQNFIICIEMFFFSLAHRLYFSYKEFLPADQQPLQTSILQGVRDMLPVDLLDHAKQHAPFRGRAPSKASTVSSEEQPPTNDGEGALDMIRHTVTTPSAVDIHDGAL